ncbi:MAG TPA: HD domain-containing protein, partial [Spirochaetia bacterium]|nr:HD domain-containing protein [Spirochaetia bacterium]
PEHEVQHNRDIFRMAAMLHDVGKVAISDTILKKPARITKKEFEIMKQHTFLGARLFSDEQSEFDTLARVIALTHHEKWNGEGYPGKIDPKTGKLFKKKSSSAPGRGLKKTEIPLWGRIVAIADVFDALSSRRVYKDAWPECRVIEELKNLSGASFDPELVELFLEILPNIRQINARYTE